MAPLVIFLYCLCFGLLLFLSVYIFLRNPRVRLNRYFSLAALSLFSWLLTLFLFDQRQDASTILWLGRLNFASIVFAAPFVYLFTAELTRIRVRSVQLLVAETIALVCLTLFTPLIDRAELVGSASHVTHYGALFPLYVLHVVLLLGSAVYIVFRSAPIATGRLRSQLFTMGTGIAATTAIACVTNIILPYRFGIFAYVDAGALSTMLALGAVAYAISAYRLFDIRIIIKKTVIFGLLLTAVHATYTSLVYFLTEWLPTGHGLDQYRLELEVLGILAVAFGLDPLKRLLEDRIDQILSHRKPAEPRRGQDRTSITGSRRSR